MNLEILGLAGFELTASEFKNETEIENVPIDENTTNKAALLSLVHKGLRYTQLEANMHTVGVFGTLDLISLKLSKMLKHHPCFSCSFFFFNSFNMARLMPVLLLRAIALNLWILSQTVCMTCQ